MPPLTAGRINPNSAELDPPLCPTPAVRCRFDAVGRPVGSARARPQVGFPV